MKSYWIDNKEESKSYKKLEEDIETDICIIGGGLTGLSTAYYLNKYKIRNVVLEKDRICHKTSGYSTAKITSQHGLFYKYLIDSEGMEIAQKYYKANEEAISEIEKIIKTEKIECDFEKQAAYVFTQSIIDVQKIKDEVTAVKSIGGEANYVEAQDIILPIKALCAIEFPNQAQFNPYKYATGLAQKCSQEHTKIYENSKVVDIQQKDINKEGTTSNNKKTKYTVILDNGKKVKAKYIVMATKYPIMNFPGYYFIKMYQSTSNVIAVKPKQELIPGMYINSEAPTISIRNVKDLALFAGFDHKTGAKIDLQNSYKYLEDVAKKIYPECEIKYRWNTEDCISLDKIPYIGQFSNFMPNMYVATGYKKWGVTTSNIAARIIVDEIMENENQYKEVYKATRLEAVKNIKEFGNMIKQVTDSLILEKIKIPKGELSQLQPGEGGIVEYKGKKAGVYKDEQGQVFAVKPVCQHLGCELSWNNLDKTWDCPCHGSRYTHKGELICGPSIKDLKLL